jgi:uncharacterized protein (TIGR02147 family)
MRTLFEYTDYRAYLQDFLAAERESGKHVTHRSFAAKVGAKSSSWLSEVIKGKKGLSKETANRISVACRHTRRETAFFEALVFFNQARSVEERNYYYKELTAQQRQAKATVLSEDQYEYYGTWYHAAVRALLATQKVRDGYAAVATQLRPRVSEADVRVSIELLERLGMIARDSDGFWELTSSAVTTGDHMGALAVANYQQEAIRLGLEAIDRFERQLRDISTVTVSISSDDAERIKEEVKGFRKRIIQIAEESPKADRAYQLNVQFFPLSAPATGQADT